MAAAADMMTASDFKRILMRRNLIDNDAKVVRSNSVYEVSTDKIFLNSMEIRNLEGKYGLTLTMISVRPHYYTVVKFSDHKSVGVRH